jgi:CRISPR/Cas system Type II protein with McrA/HNH and RuvC-like nuclease domain
LYCIENGINFKNDIIKQVQPNIQLNSVWQYIRRYLLEIGVKDNYNSPYVSYSIPEKLKKDLTLLTKNVNLTLTPRQKSEKVVVKKHDWF